MDKRKAYRARERSSSVGDQARDRPREDSFDGRRDCAAPVNRTLARGDQYASDSSSSSDWGADEAVSAVSHTSSASPAVHFERDGRSLRSDMKEGGGAASPIHGPEKPPRMKSVVTVPSGSGADRLEPARLLTNLPASLPEVHQSEGPLACHHEDYDKSLPRDWRNQDYEEVRRSRCVVRFDVHTGQPYLAPNAGYESRMRMWQGNRVSPPYERGVHPTDRWTPGREVVGTSAAEQVRQPPLLPTSFETSAEPGRGSVRWLPTEPCGFETRAPVGDFRYWRRADDERHDAAFLDNTLEVLYLEKYFEILLESI